MFCESSRGTARGTLNEGIDSPLGLPLRIDHMAEKTAPHPHRKTIVLSVVGLGLTVVSIGVGVLSYLKPGGLTSIKNSPTIHANDVSIGHVGDIINNIALPSRDEANKNRPVDEKLPGFGSGLMVKVTDITEERKKFQYSFRTPEGSKVAFYLSASNRYAFSVTDTHDSVYTLDIPLGSNGIPFEKFAFVFCEVGTASSYSYLRALVNGREVARRDLDFPIELGSRRWIPTLGSDSNGQNGGAFMFMEMGVFATTLSNSELVALAQNTLNAYGLDAAK